MGYQPRWVGLALLTPVLGCGALAESSHHEFTEPSAGAPIGEGPSIGDGPRTTGDEPESAGVPAGTSTSCGPDGVLRDSVEIRDQAGLERLAGCERIEGALLLQLFEGIDETPLLSLRDVDGSLTVEGDGVFPIPDPLAGFRSLEEVTDLLLDGLVLSDLKPLSRLRRIGTETASQSPLPAASPDQGGLEIRNSSGLTSLAGLDSLEAAHWVILENNPELLSPRGVPQLHAVQLVRLAGCPLLDLEGVGELGVEELEINGCPLLDLRGLGNASALKRLKLQNNNALQSLQGGQMPAQMETLELTDNRALLNLQGLEGLRSAQSIQISASEKTPAPGSLQGLDGLTQVGSLTVVNAGIRSLSGLGGLEHADHVQLFSDPFLSSLEGWSRLQSIDGLQIAKSPALASLRGLGTATLLGLSVSDVRQLSLAGLESVTISASLQLSGVARLSAPAGPPHLGRDVWLEIDASAELRDLQALAGITALRTLRLYQTGVENLDALSSLVELSFLDLYDNSRLQQIDGLSGVQRVTELRISENPALTSLAGLGALREVGGLQIEHNSALVELALPQLTEASVVVVHRNAALDDTALASLRGLPPPAIVKIASNQSGPSRFDPCPWPADSVCDEEPGDCAVGSDAADCRLLAP